MSTPPNSLQALAKAIDKATKGIPGSGADGAGALASGTLSAAAGAGAEIAPVVAVPVPLEVQKARRLDECRHVIDLMKLGNRGFIINLATTTGLCASTKVSSGGGVSSEALNLILLSVCIGKSNMDAWSSWSDIRQQRQLDARNSKNKDPEIRYKSSRTKTTALLGEAWSKEFNPQNVTLVDGVLAYCFAGAHQAHSPMSHAVGRSVSVELNIPSWGKCYVPVTPITIQGVLDHLSRTDCASRLASTWVVPDKRKASIIIKFKGKVHKETAAAASAAAGDGDIVPGTMEDCSITFSLYHTRKGSPEVYMSHYVSKHAKEMRKTNMIKHAMQMASGWYDGPVEATTTLSAAGQYALSEDLLERIKRSAVPAPEFDVIDATGTGLGTMKDMMEMLTRMVKGGKKTSDEGEEEEE
jgi:hypothetical protein